MQQLSEMQKAQALDIKSLLRIHVKSIFIRIQSKLSKNTAIQTTSVMSPSLSELSLLHYNIYKHSFPIRIPALIRIEPVCLQTA